MRPTTGRSTAAGRRLGALVAGGGWRRVARKEEEDDYATVVTGDVRPRGELDDWDAVVTKRRISRATMDYQRTAVRGEEGGAKPTVMRDARQTKDVQVLRDCSLRIPSGQFWMLLGPNGCGKSFLLKVLWKPLLTMLWVEILAGLLIPTSGTVYVNEPKCFVFQNPVHQHEFWVGCLSINLEV
ncbi:P-loop containing nucleoside triphosphate hydrolase [Sesbania bispinosa]|nr:P-loop containing nucleoside triphosphate hydrolase [Sesbania bispinosa]